MSDNDTNAIADAAWRALGEMDSRSHRNDDILMCLTQNDLRRALTIAMENVPLSGNGSRDFSKHAFPSVGSQKQAEVRAVLAEQAVTQGRSAPDTPDLQKGNE